MVLINQSREVLADYLLNWQAADFLRHHAIGNPGLSFRNEDIMPLEDWRALPVYTDFCHKVGVEHTLGTSILDANTRLSNMIYLWRADIDQPFTQQELAIKQAFAPHMAAAWQHRQVVALYIHAKTGSDPIQSPLRGYAVVDNLGIIHASDAMFGDTVSAVFPEWRGPDVPDALKEMITSGAISTAANGYDFALTRSDQRHILMVIGESNPTPLSAAELRTVQLFASGANYKAIAAALGLSTYTVRNQMSSAYRKLGVHSKFELAKAMKYQA
jgi:DNA-binding CsgD family transcriptional regulator